MFELAKFESIGVVVVVVAAVIEGCVRRAELVEHRVK